MAMRRSPSTSVTSISHDARRRALPQLARRLAIFLRAHVLSGDRGVADERHFMARREESHLHVVIVGLGFEHERRLAIHLGGDGLHLLIRQLIRVQHHDRGVADIALASERVDVKQPAMTVGHGCSYEEK